MSKKRGGIQMQMKPGRENPALTIEAAVKTAVQREKLRGANFVYQMLTAFGMLTAFNQMLASLSGIVVSRGNLLNDGIVSPLVPNVGQLSQLWQDYLNAGEIFAKLSPDTAPGIQEEASIYRPVINQMREAINRLYQGKDNGDMLREAMQPLINPGIADKLGAWMATYKKPGVKPQEVIERLCIRAKPHKEAGLTWEQIYDVLEQETRNEPDAWQEYEKLLKWNVENLRKRYNDRYGTN